MSADHMGGDFHLLFDASPRPMWVIDRDTLEFLEVNRAACELYGWSREEFLSMTLREIRRPEDLPQFEAVFAAEKPETSYARAACHITKSGRVMEVDLAVSRVEFRGRNAGLTILTDVTGVADADRRFRLLVENSVDGISLVDVHGVVTYMSPGAERILGLRPGELIGTRARDNMHPDEAVGAKAPHPGETVVYTQRARHHDGSYRWIEIAATNLTHDPAVRAMVANFRDVTFRHDTELRVRASEANFRRLIESSPTATFVHRDGRFLYVNPAAVAMLGYDGPADLIGRDVLAFVHPGDHEVTRRKLEHTAADGVSPRTDSRMLRRDGSIVICEGQSVVLDFDGKPSHVALAQDITERRELFAKMALADRLLSVGTLAAGVAHEINNPLAYVMTNLALLSKELPKLLDGHTKRTDIDNMLADAREGASRVHAIVRDLRLLSRPEDEQRDSVDVASALALSTRMASNEIGHRARIVETIDPCLPRVAANGSRLGQVFLNLLVNAAHAIAPGQPEVNEVRIRARADAGNVIVEIEDTGAGMAPGVVERIFDPFFTTKPPGVGIGLGLSISHQIIRSIGGSIAVTSTVGVGTAFRITLPTVPAPERVVPTRTAIETRPTRLLLIDDEPTIGRSIQMLLAPDVEVIAVTRAREALAKLESGERFDAIICDLMMPEMSGVELHAELVRTWPTYVDRIMFTSGGTFTEEARRFVGALTTPFLEKPFTEEDVRAAIAALPRDR